MKVLGYFIHKDDKEINALTAIVVLEYEYVRGLETLKQIVCYSGKEQHSDISYEYFKELVPITKEQYLQASRNFYTPIEYIS